MRKTTLCCHSCALTFFSSRLIYCSSMLRIQCEWKMEWNIFPTYLSPKFPFLFSNFAHLASREDEWVTLIWLSTSDICSVRLTQSPHCRPPIIDLWHRLVNFFSRCRIRRQSNDSDNLRDCLQWHETKWLWRFFLCYENGKVEVMNIQ